MRHHVPAHSSRECGAGCSVATREEATHECVTLQTAGLERRWKMGSTGDPPVPVGDPPTGTIKAAPRIRPSSLAGDAWTIPSGESPDGAGQWPVLPKTQSPYTLLGATQWTPIEGRSVNRFPLGGLPIEPDESPAIPIFQTCSEAPGSPVASALEAGTNAAQGLAPTTPRISVVDDDEEMHLFLKDLEAQGHFKIAGSFYTAAQALAGLPLDLPDAVIMDVRLPDSSGIDCANKLKTLLPDLPVLILTGYPDRQNFFRSLMGGARGFLVKPVSAPELLNGMRDVIRGEFSLARQVTPLLVQLVEQVSAIVQRSELSRREE